MRKTNYEDFRKFMSGKGYYIALVLCAIAIGISGYLYYRTANKQTQQMQKPQASVSATQPQQDVAVIARPTVPGATTQPLITTPHQTLAPTQPQAGKPAKTAAPLKGNTVAAYAMEALSYNPTTRDWRVHNGMDIAAEAGTPVCAAAAGQVEKVYEDPSMGFTVVIAHGGGYETTYQSLSEDVAVKAGDTVAVGQVIGTVGDSALLESAIGDHLHFGVTCNGKAVDPADFLS